MRRVRVIPIIMLDNGKGVVTRKFKDPVYIGDPINAIKIFNEKEVDELIILDITNKKRQTRPDFKLIEKMASESFMPLAYGGHVSSVSDADTLIKCGIEKISFNTTLFTKPDVVRELSSRIGKQSVVGSVDVAKNWLGKYVVKTKNGTETIGSDLEEVLNGVISLGVGEIILNSVDHDGSLTGYDEKLIERVTAAVKVPVIACGGACKIADFVSAIKVGKASAVAAGAMFFFKGSFNAVLVNYPDQKLLTSELYSKLD
jgi:imidazole glycerol-phosphate synthase subunit HisF